MDINRFYNTAVAGMNLATYDRSRFEPDTDLGA